MTLEEAIKILRQHNVKGASVLRITRGQALEKDLLSWVLDGCEQLISERVEYKRLLRAAVEDMTKEADCGICLHDNDGECPIKVTACKFKWRYADEALKLMGGETDD